MTAFFLLCGLFLVAGLGALMLPRDPRHGQNWAGGAALASVGLLAWLVANYKAVASGALTFRHAWPMPWISLNIGIDPLSLVFLIPLLIVAACAALYGREYMVPFWERRSIGLHWLWFNLLIVSMIFVVVARNALLFLLAWEVMSLSSFFLATFENEKDSVLESGWVYLVSAHIGMAFLTVLFLLMGAQSGSFEFGDWQQHTWSARGASLFFLLALVGFGSKAGFIPFHVWLPLAHPAAPSHVSALMSGVMIKMGIFGLVRMLSLLGPAPLWWAAVLLGTGMVSGILGVLFALGQHDVKKLLAYSSVENIGIITLGLGMGVLGNSLGLPFVSALGFAGALLHVVNHALFKSLLFMGAGAVAHATGTRDMDRLGGLMKKMPITGALFLAGAIAISGIPPFNGFISEFLIYKSAWAGGFHNTLEAGLFSVLGFASLALIGGLATAGFAKPSGIIFLGEPRSSACGQAHEPGPAMLGSMAVLAALCLLIGLGSGAIIQWLAAPVSLLSGSQSRAMLTAEQPVFYGLAGVYGLVALLFGIVYAVRRRALRRQGTALGPTWDCGYAQPAASMQYTSSSFASPIVDFFSPFLRGRKKKDTTQGFFPQAWSFHSEVADWVMERIYTPAFRGVDSILKRFLWVQSGRLHLYILYILITLLVLVIWKVVLGF